MDSQKLIDTAQALVVKSKGILAADESGGTIKRRFDSINVESTEDNRRDYREMLFRTEGVSDYISGVILFDETIKQNGADGTPIVKVLLDRGIIPGIKVDKGTQALPGSPSELVTEGLDGLRARLEEYASLGAGFTKWRGVITIGEGIPTPYCIEANAHALARFAALSQEAGLVPIVEPEVLMDGEHDIKACYSVTENTLKCVFEVLDFHNVMLEGIVLKPNMVISGLNSPKQANVEEVSKQTVKCLRENVPESVPGIAFLSGGQSSDDATSHLYTMNKNNNDLPWNLTFSYGRALQSDALVAWGGDNWREGQEALLNRAKNNGLASMGKAL